MPATTGRPLLRIGRRELTWILGLAAAGIVVSWAFFFTWFGAHGADLGRFWAIALWSGDSAGLVWDLIFCGAILTTMTIARWEQLGPRAGFAILGATAILGVCLGLGLFAWFVARQQPPSPARGPAG